jgi:hypothetical protein
MLLLCFDIFSSLSRGSRNKIIIKVMISTFSRAPAPEWWRRNAFPCDVCERRARDLSGTRNEERNYDGCEAKGFLAAPPHE